VVFHDLDELIARTPPCSILLALPKARPICPAIYGDVHSPAIDYYEVGPELDLAATQCAFTKDSL